MLIIKRQVLQPTSCMYAFNSRPSIGILAVSKPSPQIMGDPMNFSEVREAGL